MTQVTGGNDSTYDFTCMEPLAGSPLRGGHIAVLGSSVARGEASEGWAVGEYLAARLGTQLTKEAVSGTTLADTGPQSYVRRLRRLDPDARYDLFLCQLSTNDATLRLPRGGIAPGRDPAEFDTSTTLGALETILEYALRTWHCPAAVFTGSRYDSKDYAALVAAQRQENAALEADIAAGPTDEKLEEIARDELGLVKPGEYVFEPSG